MREGEAGAERHAGADDAVAAVEPLVAGEHVHRAALALGVAGDPPGQLGHDPARVHAGRQHVAVVAVARDHRIALADRVLHADRDRLLADVEMAEAADQPHAIHLAGLLLEASDQQHLAVVGHQQLAIDVRDRLAREVVLADDGYLALGSGHDRTSHWLRPTAAPPDRRPPVPPDSDRPSLDDNIWRPLLTLTTTNQFHRRRSPAAKLFRARARHRAV